LIWLFASGIDLPARPKYARDEGCITVFEARSPVSVVLPAKR
jgi:hypothetical protein